MSYFGGYFGGYSGAYFGGGSGSSSDVVLRFQMPSFGVYPFNYPMVSDRVNLGWDLTNVSSIKVYAVGVEGSRKLITDNAQGTFRIPSGTSTKWNTAMAQDFGADIIADTYDPVASSDDSAAMVSDPDRIASFELLPAFTCLYLEYVITKVSTSETVNIHHPTFYLAPLSDAKVFHETGAIQAILFKDGPIVRPGSQSYFNYLTDDVLTTPLPVNPIFGTTTIGDGWSLENSYFKGKLATDGNLTRMGAEYVENEEFPAGVTKHLWRFKDEEDNYFVDSISFWANSEYGPKLLYYSSWRASTPSCYFLPTKLRSAASGWADTGIYGMWRYSYGTSRHPHIVPGDILPQLKKDDIDTLAFEPSPHGWSVGMFSDPVDNNEGYDWEFWWNGVLWFKMRPWRGQSSVLGMAVAGGRNVSYDVCYGSVFHVLATINDAEMIILYRSGNDFAWFGTSLSLTAQWVCVRIDRDSPEQTILLVTEDAGEVKLFVSSNRGDDFTLSDTVASGSKPVILVGRQGMRHIYWIDGTDVKGQLRDRQNNIVESTFVVATGVDDAGIAADEDVTELGERRVHLVAVIGGAITQFNSTDGKNFS